MNSNELMEDLLRTLKNSGWLDKANEFYHNHPEYFKPANYSGYISSLHLSVSYQPKTLTDVAEIKPCVFISMDDSKGMSREFNEYSFSGRKYSRIWIDGNTVTEVPIV